MAHESNLDKLIKMRFVECGEWTAHDGQLTAKLLKCADEPKVLYAFVVDGMVVYIGKTIRSLRSRMQGLSVSWQDAVHQYPKQCKGPSGS